MKIMAETKTNSNISVSLHKSEVDSGKFLSFWKESSSHNWQTESIRNVGWKLAEIWQFLTSRYLILY